MAHLDSIQQPTGTTTLQLLAKILQNAPPESLDVGAAYITSSGLRDFLRAISESLGDEEFTVQQRWLTSFDYCRTEPVALEKILSLENASVRIHDGDFCLSRGCTPRVPFHPKAFFIRNQHFDYLLAGSGNISRSGLSRGYEAGLSVGIDRRTAEVESSAADSINLAREWFTLAWNNADPLTEEILARYKDEFESIEKRKNPSPTEDDTSSDHPTAGSLNSGDLKKLRVCRNFWIEAGNISRNRGPSRPGNQLMMKRLSRVFFGFSPKAVPENSAIGSVEISLDSSNYETCSLTYSDNKMDKLVLPVPGAGGPDEYDNKDLLFSNTAPGRFHLVVGSKKKKRQWVKDSKKIDGVFSMRSGRQWGVF